ncbi:potassium/proton antiporter [Cellulomonas flavigena DSM 20109]|uniref:Potassium/proton antiporter n=1 Tax=Cellulomonas flavigena (strain ATCC 482 / DSM 20109 / BCRC 11376 / JCM 18109 / NBRC 3775 / NCIMB 8073 / NRS 134) TaxID=446466 RepID=D5UDX2_CELFN|nr:hypothetical protein [Cellulomonas flavigena]ADG74530.1 potassium/proton antiporter [Cellulomonas flavigena DSM 20109]
MTDDDASTDGTARSLTMTDELLRAMTRDVTALLLRSRQALGLWAGFFAVVVPVLLVVAATVGDTDLLLLYLGLVLVTVAVLVVVQVLVTRRSVRRALVVALPQGTDVRVAVTGEELQQRGALGSSQTAWSAFRDVRVRGAAAVLRLRGSSAFVVLPSALLTDADLAVIRARLG